MELEQRLLDVLAELNLQEVKVQLEGNHCRILAVDARFDELSIINRQRLIMNQLKNFVATNEVHALHIKTFNPENWEKQKAEFGF